ncbi:MAG: hypothetical protein NVSMB9_11350 [Isosphaeraceae bacterium]
MNCGKPKLLSLNDNSKAIRSLAWSGMGGQDGSETSGVSPNNTPRRERPASSGSVALVTTTEEGEIVQAPWKRGGP